MAHYAAALSLHPVPVEAVGECAGQLLDALGGTRPDLIVVFATAAHTGTFGDMTAALRSLLDPEVLVGTTAVAVAGGGREVEDEPALSVWAGAWDRASGSQHVRGVRLEAH